MRKAVYFVGTIIVVAGLAFIGFSLHIFTFFTPEQPPHYFPFGDTVSEYRIVKEGTPAVYTVLYKGQDRWGLGTDADGFLHVTVGKTNYLLGQFHGRRVVIESGDFVEATRQCVAGACTPLPRRTVVVDIDKINAL